MAATLADPGHCRLHLFLAPGASPATDLALLPEPIHFTAGCAALPLPKASSQPVPCAQGVVSRWPCHHWTAMGHCLVLAALGSPQYPEPQPDPDGPAGACFTPVAPIPWCHADPAPDHAAPFPVPDPADPGTALGNLALGPGHRRSAVQRTLGKPGKPEDSGAPARVQRPDPLPVGGPPTGRGTESPAGKGNPPTGTGRAATSGKPAGSGAKGAGSHPHAR